MVTTTGERPGAGTYICLGCNQIVILDDDTDTMPPCPACVHAMAVHLDNAQKRKNI